MCTMKCGHDSRTCRHTQPTTPSSQPDTSSYQKRNLCRPPLSRPARSRVSLLEVAIIQNMRALQRVAVFKRSSKLPTAASTAYRLCRNRAGLLEDPRQCHLQHQRLSSLVAGSRPKDCPGQRRGTCRVGACRCLSLRGCSYTAPPGQRRVVVTTTVLKTVDKYIYNWSQR